MRRSFVSAAFLLLCLACADVLAAAKTSQPTFYARRDYPDYGDTWLAVADTNGDGIPDVIRFNGHGQAAVLFGNGKRHVSPGPRFAPRYVAAHLRRSRPER